MCHANTRDGLIGWWKLDEKSGTSAVDSSWNGRNGTISNMSGFTTGPRNGAFIFNGAASSCSDVTSTISSGLSGDFTFSAWVNVGATSSAVPTIMASETAGSFWAIIYMPGGGVRPEFNLFDGTNQPQAFAPNVARGVWFHVVGMRDTAQDKVRIWVNGVEGTSATDTTTSVPTYSAFDIGYQASASNCNRSFDGMIDDVRVYNRALTAQEIKDLYNPGMLIRGNGTTIRGTGTKLNY